MSVKSLLSEDVKQYGEFMLGVIRFSGILAIILILVGVVLLAVAFFIYGEDKVLGFLDDNVEKIEEFIKKLTRASLSTSKEKDMMLEYLKYVGIGIYLNAMNIINKIKNRRAVV